MRFGRRCGASTLEADASFTFRRGAARLGRCLGMTLRSHASGRLPADMGRGIVSAGLHRTERVKLETRTTDPPGPADGERWLRTDLSDTANDKLAELRWFDGSRTKSVDIVAPGTTDNGVAEILRIQTPGGLGVIPAISPPGDAGHPSQRLRHAGADYGLGVITVLDSAIHQYRMDEGSGETVGDAIGSYDGSLSDSSAWVSGTWTGEFAIQGDGSAVDVDIGNLGSFGQLTDSAVAFTFEGGSLDNSSRFLSSFDNNGSEVWQIGPGGKDVLRVRLRDQDGNEYRKRSTDALPSGKIRLVINKTSNTNIDFYVNATQQSAVTDRNEGYNQTQDLATPFFFFKRGSLDDNYYDGIMDNAIFYDAPLSSSEIQDDYDRQPWS